MSNIDKKLPPITQNQHQTRIFAGITDATSLILKKINYPVNKQRNIICTLQGIANSRERFKATNLLIARRLEHEGSDDAAKMSAYRALNKLKNFQAEKNIILFDIIQGGGVDHKKNEYIDYITPAATWLYNKAKEEKYKRSSKDAISMIMNEFIQEAMDKLPCFDESLLQNTYSKNKKKSSKKTLSRNHPLKQEILSYIKYFNFDDQLSDDSIEKLSIEIKAIAKDFIKRNANNNNESKKKNVSEVLPMSSSPIYNNYNKNEIIQGGLQNCSPLIMKALEYVAYGFSVIPLHTPSNYGCSCYKGIECTSIGKHPRTRNGLKDASRDSAQIKKWWLKFPNANIGIVTGRISNIICLDVDPRHHGDKSLSNLMDKYGILPKTLTVSTGGGGMHFYFKYSSTIIKNSAGLLGKGLDIRTDGGFIVAPPSLHQSGNLYELASNCKPAELPIWIENLLTSKEKDQTTRKSKPNQIISNQNDNPNISIVQGIRNEKLFKIGCGMIGRGESVNDIRAEIEKVNSQECDIPLDPSEINRIIENANKYR